MTTNPKRPTQIKLFYNHRSLPLSRIPRRYGRRTRKETNTEEEFQNRNKFGKQPSSEPEPQAKCAGGRAKEL